jgi:nicotinamidase-related amidase
MFTMERLRVTPMTSAPIRDVVADHLITPQNSALIVIDYQPGQLAAVRSMDHDLLITDIVSTVRAAKLFGVPVVHSTVMWPVAKGRLSPELGVGDVVGCRGKW